MLGSVSAGIRYLMHLKASGFDLHIWQPASVITPNLATRDHLKSEKHLDLITARPSLWPQALGR
jgi:hypothetical protein